jgi:hypothetical protein
MNARLFFVLPLVFAATIASAAPAGFKPATSKKGECETIVPNAWGPGFAGIGMKAPSGASNILVSFKPGTIPSEKAGLKGVYTVTKTYEDSAARYWIEYKEGSGSVRHWYIVTPAAGGNLCAAILDFDSALSETDAKTIATGLKKH